MQFERFKKYLIRLGMEKEVFAMQMSNLHEIDALSGIDMGAVRLIHVRLN